MDPNAYARGMEWALAEDERKRAASERADLIQFVRLVADYKHAAFASDADKQRSAFAIEARTLLTRIKGE